MHSSIYNKKARLYAGIWIASVLFAFSSWLGYLIFIHYGYGPDFNHLYRETCIFVSKNWEIVSLVLSEIAAILPGPWNGIIQAFIKIVSRLRARKKL